MAMANGSDIPTPNVGATNYIPLRFWFNRNPGLALPLIALQYHEVKINIEFREARSCFNGTGAWGLQTPSLRSASLYVDYIYLDTDERRRFAQVSHEYLIEQLQFNGNMPINSTVEQLKLSGSNFRLLRISESSHFPLETRLQASKILLKKAINEENLE